MNPLVGVIGVLAFLFLWATIRALSDPKPKPMDEFLQRRLEMEQARNTEILE